MIVLALAFAAGIKPPAGLPNYTHPLKTEDRVLARARALEVHTAIDAATQDPELRAELRRICRRESACNWFGEVTYHKGDAAGGRARWRMAVASGALRPDECPAHELGEPERWTSYGPFGVAAAWTVRYAGACVGPEHLDDPRVAASVVVAWMGSLCRRQRACDCEARVRWWVGPGIWAARSPWLQLEAVERQCGDQPLWRWGLAAVTTVLGPLAPEASALVADVHATARRAVALTARRGETNPS